MGRSIEMDLIRKLVSGRRQDRISAASSKHATETVMGIAANHLDPLVRVVASRNPRMSGKILMSMLMADIRSNRADSLIRVNIARNPSSTRRVLLGLLGVCWTHPEISLNITRHPNADKKFVDIAFRSSNPSIRSLAVLCPSASESVLLRAIKDEDVAVRSNALCNPRATERLLLAAMKIEGMSIMAIRHPNATDKIFDLVIKSNSLLALDSAVRNASATADVLMHGILSGHDAIRYNCACHLNATREVLEIAVKDKNHSVRCGVASNPKTPYEIWSRLLKDKHPKVKKSLLYHPKAEKWSDPLFFLLQRAKKKTTMVS